MRRLPLTLVAALSLFCPPKLFADCDPADGHLRWLSGLDISGYQPGEGTVGLFLDVAVLGDFLLASTDWYGTRVYEITGPGQLSFADSNSEVYFHEAIVEDGRVYAASFGTLSILSVSETGDLSVLSQHPVSSGYAVALEGDFAYVAAGGTLITVDVSDPFNPATVDNDPADAYGGLSIYGDRLYAGSLNREIAVFDISDPADPLPLGQVLQGPASVTGMAIESDHLFVSWFNHGVTAFDLVDPDVPVEVGSLLADNARELVIESGIAAFASDGLSFLDISDPTTMTITGSFRSAGLDGMAVKDGVVYVADGSLQALEMGNKTSPAPIATSLAAAEGEDLRVVGDYLVLYLRNSLEVISIENPATPIAVASLPFNRISGIDTQGSYAFVSDWDGFHVVDLADPTSPAIVATLPDVPSADVVATGDRVYVSYWARTTTIDVADPTDPVVLGESNLWQESWTFAAEGNTVYLPYEFEGWGEIFQYDFTDPTAPTIIDVRNSEPIRSLEAINGELFAGEGARTLRLDGSSMSTIGSVFGCGLAEDGIHVSPSGAIHTWGGGFHTFSPVGGLEYVSSGSPPSGSVDGLVSDGEYLYVTDSSGLHVFREPCVPAEVVPGSVARTLHVLRSHPNPSAGPTVFLLDRPTDGEGGSSPASESSMLELFSIDGRLLRTLPVGSTQSVQWDGRDAGGRSVSSGVVLARWTGPEGTASTTLRLLR